MRLLTPTAALLWGLQFAFLTPALALLLVAVFGATPGQVGWVVAVYNAGGFVASLALPAYADRKQRYLQVMLACGVLTLALAAALALATSVPVAAIALVLLGGPAGVGSSLLFAHLKHSGAAPADVVNTRAIVSVAWVAGPPLATFIIGWLGNRAILAAIAAVALLNIATTAAMLRRRSGPSSPAETTDDDGRAMSRTGVALVLVAFIILQATNTAAVSIMSLFVTRSLGLAIAWAGLTLGAAAALEIPALLLLGRLSRRWSSLPLLASGCLAGIAYYAAMTYASGPVMLLGLQVLNAWFFATVAGTGLALMQRIIPRPGLATGLYTNTRRLGAIVAGPIIALASATALGYAGVFAAGAGLTVLALAVIAVAARTAPE